MHSRRSFIEKTAKGLTLSTIGLAAPSALFSGSIGDKPKIIGIIGAENSHTIHYGKMFNIEKRFPGFEAKYVWGETAALAERAKEKGGIPTIVKDPNEMLGKIDALIVDHRRGDQHLEPATPFVKAGIPTFIDKPFCFSTQKAREFLSMAREAGTPVTSFSTIAHSYDTLDMKKQLDQMKDINQVVRYGPADLNSEYGGIYFYGPHLVQPLLYLFDEKVVSARVNRNFSNSKNSSAALVYENGMMITLIFTTKKYGWQTFIETDEGVRELKSTLSKSEDDLGKAYIDMVEMFKTGVEPRSHESIIGGVAVLEALYNSSVSGQWETVSY